MRAKAQGNGAPLRQRVHRHEFRQRKARQHGGGQQTDHTQPDHGHPFADDGAPVHDEVDCRLHVGQQRSAAQVETGRNRDQLAHGRREVARVWVKGKDLAADPGSVGRGAGGNDATDSRVAVAQREGDRAVQRLDRAVHGCARRHLTAQKEQFSARADRRRHSLDQHLAGLWLGDCLAHDGDFTGRGKEDAYAVHAGSPQMMRSSPACV